MVFVSICVGVDRQSQEAQGIDSILLYYHFCDTFALFGSFINSVKHNAEKRFLQISGIQNLQVHTDSCSASCKRHETHSSQMFLCGTG